MTNTAISITSAGNETVVRLQTSRVNADLTARASLSLNQAAHQQLFFDRLARFRSLGYVDEDAAVLALLGDDANFLRADHFPRLHDHVRSSSQDQCLFAPLRNKAPGIYPIVDSLDHLQQMLDAGAQIVQLRIKSDSTTPSLLNSINSAVKMAASYPQSQLFINDHWRAAIELGAYGVHLGQEDLQIADLQAIAAAGLRLGVSSHAFWEVARALSISPSYIACGPIFPTRAKAMPWIAQGIENLHYWSTLLPMPVVAIGGINAENLAAVRKTGCASASVIAAITASPSPTHAYRALQALWNEGSGKPDHLPKLARPTLAN